MPARRARSWLASLRPASDVRTCAPWLVSLAATPAPMAPDATTAIVVPIVHPLAGLSHPPAAGPGAPEASSLLPPGAAAGGRLTLGGADVTRAPCKCEAFASNHDTLGPVVTHRKRPRSGRHALWLSAAAGVLFGAAASHAAPATTLTLYAAQHHQLVDMVIAAFTKQTGIAVKTRFGEAPELAAQIVREGARSPADLYFTENSPELVLLDEKKLLGPVDPATLQAVPAKYSPTDGSWVGVLVRENVLTFDPAKIKEAELPASLYDLAKPEWKGKVAIAPSDADFLPLIAASVALKGRDATLAWLKGLKANAAVFDDDEGVVAAVERGSVATGVINSYYYYRASAEQGAGKTRSQIHHFGSGDLGALLNVSGAAVLKSSKHSPRRRNSSPSWSASRCRT